MGHGTHLRIGRTEDAIFADDRHLSFRQHVHIRLNARDAGILRLQHGVIIPRFIAASLRRAGIRMDRHAVIQRIGAQIIHLGDEGLCLIAGIDIRLIICAFCLIDLSRRFLDGR